MRMSGWIDSGVDRSKDITFPVRRQIASGMISFDSSDRGDMSIQSTQAGSRDGSLSSPSLTISPKLGLLLAHLSRL